MEYGILSIIITLSMTLCIYSYFIMFLIIDKCISRYYEYQYMRTMNMAFNLLSRSNEYEVIM